MAGEEALHYNSPKKVWQQTLSKNSGSILQCKQKSPTIKMEDDIFATDLNLLTLAQLKLSFNSICILQNTHTLYSS